MVALMTFYGLFWAAGGNDIIAIKLHSTINQITYFMRVAVFIGPVIAFVITRRWCISLQRKDNETLLHGYETGIIMRSPEGGYSERHLPLPESQAYTLTARDRDPAVNGGPTAAPTPTASPPRARVAWPACGTGSARCGTPTTCRSRRREELEDGHHHADHEHELQEGRRGPRGRRPPVRRPPPGRGRDPALALTRTRQRTRRSLGATR